MNETQVVPGSFRDPSGFVFTDSGTIFRQVNQSYRDDYEQLIASGLYESLVKSNLLIPHEEEERRPPRDTLLYKVIRPERVPFISYPFEWSFGQLRDAALVTLSVQAQALEHGMILKDGTALNVQFLGSRPVFIDTLSFERYREGMVWAGYKQFCGHFLAPLALMACRHIELHQLQQVYTDGIPLDLASSLLPSWTLLSFPLLSHIHLHARSQRHFERKPSASGNGKMSRAALLALLENLRSCIEGLKSPFSRSNWTDYYDTAAQYSSEALARKQGYVVQFLAQARPTIVWDLGANTGMFSRLAASQGIYTVALDADHGCVERVYQDAAKSQDRNILPLRADINNPTPSLGWENRETMSLLDRGPADAALALALVHHLAIGNNVPLFRIAEFFDRICRRLLIEFVPKSDPQVQQMLSSRRDIFPDYTVQTFECAFDRFFEITDSVLLPNSGRRLYCMKKRRT
ncbi:MAG TPA: SAM-dependent methyltransferase [Terriglobia bacterium]|jgi:ribosomal protein L11 methylase PrmA|nr:SAM-dependent methyltransferase [Terriglobia bacterium]